MKQRITNPARRTERRSRVWLLGVALAMIPASRAQSPRFAVTADQVVAAMQGHAWPVSGVQVRLPAAITTAVADPKLGIETASMLTAHQARLRIVCRVPAACLPFFATAVWPDSAEPVSPPSGESLAAGRTTPASTEPASTEPKTPAQDASPHKLRAGAPVVLMLEGERIHIRLQAISLQGGEPGDHIRVSTRDRRQTYVAEILTPTLLRGSLPQ